MAKVCMLGLPITGGEGVRKTLGPNAVDGACEVTVGNGRVPGLYAPHGLAEFTDCGRRIKHNLCTIESESLPVGGMVSSIANVDGYLPVRGFEHRVAGVAFHIVRALVEVADARDVVLTVLPYDIPVVADDHSRVPEGATMHIIALEDRADDHHVIASRICLTQLRGWPLLCTLAKLAPVLLSRAESERHCPGLLQAQDFHASRACALYHLPHAIPNCFALLGVWL
mmetsp:Transcript_8129/g.29999  ORF Transcript_8129/g.29999 Transcript_8129/m.29999 type:complete len:226 (+) Transcript_8129:1145-1822(+)